MPIQDNEVSAYPPLGNTWARHREECIRQRHRQFGYRGKLHIKALLQCSARAAQQPVSKEAESRSSAALFQSKFERFIMSKEIDNKAIVGRWFTDFWGTTYNPAIVDELASPEMLLQYSLHEPRRGREDIKAFMADFRAAFPDLSFAGAADLIAEGDFVVGRWVGGGTHTGSAFDDFLMGALPAATGKKMRFTGTTVLRLQDGLIVEEMGLDDGVTALQQLGLLSAA